MPSKTPKSSPVAKAVAPKPASPAPPQEFRAQLALSPGAVALIIEGLGELPAKHSAQTIAAISQEVERQYKAWQADQHGTTQPQQPTEG